MTSIGIDLNAISDQKVVVRKRKQQLKKVKSDNVSEEVKEAEKKVLELQEITNQQRQRMKEQYEALLVRDRVRDARKRVNGRKEKHKIAMQKAKKRIDNARRLQQKYIDLIEDLAEKEQEIIDEDKIKILMRDKFNDNGEVISYLLIENGKLKEQNEQVRTEYKGKVDEHLKGVNSKINRLEVLTKSRRGSMGSTFRQYLQDNCEKDKMGSMSSKNLNKKKEVTAPQETNNLQFFDSIPRDGLQDNYEKNQTGAKKHRKKNKVIVPQENDNFQFFDSIPREGLQGNKKNDKKKKLAVSQENNDLQFFDSIPREKFKVETIDDKMKKLEEQAAKLKELAKKQTQGLRQNYSRRLEDKFSDLKKKNDDFDQQAKKALQEAEGRIDYYKMMQGQYINDYEVSENKFMKNKEIYDSISENIKSKKEQIKKFRGENEEKEKNKERLRLEYEAEVSNNEELHAYNRRASQDIYDTSPDSGLDTILIFSVLKETSKGLKEKYKELSEEVEEWQNSYWLKASKRVEMQQRTNQMLNLIETNCKDKKLIKASFKLASGCKKKNDKIMTHLQSIYGDNDGIDQADEKMI